MKVRISIYLIITFILSISYLWAGENKKERDRLIVFDLTAEIGIEKGAANTITEIVIDEVTKLNRYEVIGQKDLDKMLFWESQKNIKNCTESSCLVQIAGAMGAKYYVEGSIGGMGSKYVVTLKWMDAEKVEIINRKTMRINRDEDTLIDEICMLVKEVFGEEKKGEVKKEKAKKEELKQEKKEGKDIVTNKGEEIKKAVGKVEGKRGKDNSLSYLFMGIGLAGIGGGISGTVLGMKVDKDFEDGKYKGIEEAKDEKAKWGWVSIGGYTLGGLSMIYGIYRLIDDGEEGVKSSWLRVNGGINYISMEAIW